MTEKKKKSTRVVAIKLRDPNAPAKPRKPKSLLNPKQCREKLLAVLQKRRPALAERMSRVAKSALVALEGDLLNIMERRIDTMPSVGKTLRFD